MSAEALVAKLRGFREALARVVDGGSLSADEMADVVGQIMDGEATPAQVGALLTALRMKGETVDEVVGAARAMRSRMRPVPHDLENVLDTCGTGGDGSGSVNVTTLASFVVAACGVRVGKHGNRAMSSKAGSHDVLEALGVDPAPDPDLAVRCLREVGICFIFAPAYHAATKHAVGPRRELGFRTFFNLLGPLTNPAGSRLHVNGVFSSARCDFLARAHKALGSRRALVVHGTGGLDEIAPTGPTYVAELAEGGEVRSYEITPKDFGLPESDAAGLRGGDAAFNARLLRDALDGAPGPIRHVAVMTASAALYVAGSAPSLRAGAELAADALDSGRARAVLAHLQKIAPVPAKPV
jgi:anthranilate phosphoribosyltransferase